VVANLLRGEIQNGGEGTFGGQRFEGAAAHAGGMEHGHLKPALFKRRFQTDHIAQHGLAKAGHADQRAIAFRRFDRAGGPQNRACGLRQRGLADRVQPVKTARPEDHLDVGGKALGRDHRGKADGRDDVFRHTQGQSRAEVQRKVGSH
jgi:hypothetical protein